MPLANKNKKCSNCGTDHTPLWRRTTQGATVCNACGLYLRSKKAPRPTSDILSSDLGSSDFSESGDSSDYTANAKLSGDKSNLICNNCNTTKTPLWRRLEGKLICNACGLYHKLHGVHRPTSLVKSVVLTRKRYSPHSVAPMSPPMESKKSFPRLKVCRNRNPTIVSIPLISEKESKHVESKKSYDLPLSPRESSCDIEDPWAELRLSVHSALADISTPARACATPEPEQAPATQNTAHLTQYLSQLQSVLSQSQKLIQDIDVRIANYESPATGSINSLLNSSY